MKINKWIILKSTLNGVVTFVLLMWTYLSTCDILRAQTPPDSSSAVSPDLQSVVKLYQSHVGDDVVIAYIKNSGKPYQLSTDDIIYLVKQGVSKDVINALQTTSSANEGSATGTSLSPSPPTPATTDNSRPGATSDAPTPASDESSNTPPPDAAEKLAYYQTQLGPYGNWVIVQDAGSCWVPNEINTHPDWRPYVDAGQWSYTDAGWFW